MFISNLYIYIYICTSFPSSHPSFLLRLSSRYTGSCFASFPQKAGWSFARFPTSQPGWQDPKWGHGNAHSHDEVKGYSYGSAEGLEHWAQFAGEISEVEFIKKREMRRFFCFEADVSWIRSGLQYSGVQWSKLPKIILSSDLFKFHTGLRNFIALMAFLSRKHRFLTAKSSCAVPELLMALGHCVKKAQEGPIGKRKKHVTKKKRQKNQVPKKKQALFGVCVWDSQMYHTCAGKLLAAFFVPLGVCIWESMSHTWCKPVCSVQKGLHVEAWLFHLNVIIGP